MKKLATKIHVIALGVFLLSANINPTRAGGDLDPGFGNGGKVTTTSPTPAIQSMT